MSFHPATKMGGGVGGQPVMAWFHGGHPSVPSARTTISTRSVPLCAVVATAVGPGTPKRILCTRDHNPLPAPSAAGTVDIITPTFPRHSPTHSLLPNVACLSIWAFSETSLHLYSHHASLVTFKSLLIRGQTCVGSSVTVCNAKHGV